MQFNIICHTVLLLLQENDGFVYDNKYSAGVHSDWLLDLSIYSTSESGRRIANYLIKYYDPKKLSNVIVGLPSEIGTLKL